MKTAIICAMERESDALLGYAQNVRAETRNGVEIYTGTISGKEVAVCRSGVGKAFAAAATAVLIERFSPEAIISSGVAGGDASLKPGTVFIASRSVEHDYFVPDEQVRYFPSDQTLLYRAQEACLSEKCEFFAGTIASGDCFVTGEQKIAELKNRFSALAFDMECAAIMKICTAAGVKSVCIRVISDNGNDDGMKSYYDFLDRAAHRSAHIIAKMLEKM